MTDLSLYHLEKQASELGLLLRIQVRRPLDLWTLRLVVARNIDNNKIEILGEMKGWAYKGKSGLQLDTMTVSSKAPAGVGYLIWAATMSWALEETPCIRARLLAIRDDDTQHELLVRYFCQRGFKIEREVGASPLDLPLRLVWGGAGSLMVANCSDVLELTFRKWNIFRSDKLQLI